MSARTWEFIVQPQKPLPLSEIEVIISEGEPLMIGAKRPDLYEEVLRYWNESQVRMTLARADELADALKTGDEARVRRMSSQIGGVNQKHRLSRAFFDEPEKKLYVAMSSTNYMDFVGTNERAIRDPDFRKRLMKAGMKDYADSEHYFANPLAVCAVVYGFDKASDDVKNMYIPLSLRSEKVIIYPHTYHVFGGLVDVDESRTTMSIGGQLIKELQEEIGLLPSEIGSPSFYGIIRQKPSRLPEAILSVPVFVGQKQLEEQWRKHAPGKFESRHLSFYSYSQIPGFLQQYGQTMVPSGAAALELFVKHQQDL